MANKQNKRPVLPPQKKPVQKPSPPGKVAAPKKEEIKEKNPLKLKLALLLGVIALIVYANTLKNGFVLDDFTVIKENAIVRKGISAIPEILSTPYRRGYFITSNDLYRPLSLVMFATEYEIWGLNPTPNHLINILLFAGCVVLLFLFLDSLFERKKTGIAFIATLIFALHPIHTEVVANIKSRDELLCFFFSFLSLNVFLKYIASGKIGQLVIGAFCFFLALLSKETVITFLAVIPMIFFFYRNENKKRSIYISIFSAVAAIIFLFIRSSVLDFYHANEIATIKAIDNALAMKDLATDSRFATAILIMGYYVKLFFIPYPLISDYSLNSIPFVHFSDSIVLLSLAFYIFLIVFGVVRVIKYPKDPIAFAILFFLITISLFSNIFFLIGTTMGERLMFFPSLGFCLAIAFLIEKVAGRNTDTGIALLKNKKVLAVIIPVSVVFIILTINRNSDWLSNYSLYTADIKKVPGNSRLYYELGTELEYAANEEKDPAKQKKIRDSVMADYRKSLAIWPDNSEAECNLGSEFFYTAQWDSAEVHEKKSIELTHRQINAINNLAAVYINEFKFNEAIVLCKNAIALNPYASNPYINLAACYLNLRKYDSAIYFSHEAVAADPSNKRPYTFLSMAYTAIGRTDSAKIYDAIAKNK